MAWHILTQGRYKSIMSSFESRRSNSILRGSIRYAGQMDSLMDSLFFVHVCMYRSTCMCMYQQVASQPASQPIQLPKKISSSWIIHDRISTVCSKVVNTTQRRTCIHAFQVVFQHATKCFNKLCLVCYLVSFFLSPSFSPLPARSIWRWLISLFVHNFSTS